MMSEPIKRLCRECGPLIRALLEAIGKRIPFALRVLFRRPSSVARALLEQIKVVAPYVTAILGSIGLMALIRHFRSVGIDELQFGPILPGPYFLSNHLRPFHPQVMTAPFIMTPAGQASAPPAGYQPAPPQFHIQTQVQAFWTRRTRLLGLNDMVACLQLVSYLRQLVYFKVRDKDLFEVLRRKAIAWCQANEMRPLDVEYILLGSVLLSMWKSPTEQSGEIVALNFPEMGLKEPRHLLHRLLYE